MYLVILNDPGGANIVLSYIVNNFKVGSFDIVNKGPVEVSTYKTKSLLFNEITIQQSIINIENKKYSAVFTGTSKFGDLEFFLTGFARVKGIQVASLLDHWVNYRERYTRYDETIVPSEVWVSDDKALLMAANIFKNQVPIRKIDNHYVNDTVCYIKENYQPTNIIYLSQPDVENQSAIDKLKNKFKNETIYVKPHPKDNTEYLEKTIKTELKFALLSAKMVFGHDTMAMHIADLAEIPTYTFKGEIQIPRGNIKHFNHS